MIKSKSLKELISCSVLFFFVFLNKAGYSEEKRPFKPGFSIKVTGGLGYVSIGDLNRCLESLNEEYRPGEYSPGDSIKSRTGELEMLDKFTPDCEVELRIHISPKFVLGIGTSGYIHLKNESSIQITRQILEPLYEDFIFEDLITIKSEVKAWMPVKVGIYYSLLHSSRINFFLTGGIGCYSANMSEHKIVEEINFLGGSSHEWRYWEIRHRAGLSFNGGLGLEYSLTKNLALVVEAQGKYAKIKNLKGTTQYGSHELIEIERSGTLYYFESNFLGPSQIKSYYDLEILEGMEDDTPVYHRWNIRKAFLDLSGISLRMGIRINLF